MNTTAKAHEPTMEEILASIRRIISDDEPGAAEVPPSRKTVEGPKLVDKPKLEPVSQPLGQDDIDAMLASFDEPAPSKPVLDKPEPAPKSVLAMKPVPAPKQDKPAAAPVPTPAAIAFEADLDVFELTDDMAMEPAPPSQPRPPEPRLASMPDERLISQNTDEAVGAAFGSLAHTILSSNARTIDDVVREMLRPMLRAWLDDNLPPLVERLVRQEIERVARGGR